MMRRKMRKKTRIMGRHVGQEARTHFTTNKPN